MKKLSITILSVLVVFIMIGASAYAWKGGGPGYGGQGCPCYSSVDPAKAQQFYNDTTPIRQKMLQLRGELMQLYAQPNPDWNAISKKQQEMVQVRTELQKRAHEYGLPYGKMGMHRCGRGW
ncbi:hypothetical protein [Thermodesulfovibrio hydrogeniphilus]